jgi:hypothetical protein
MTRAGTPIRRALTMIELMLALSVTAMVAAAISAMLHATSTGVQSRHDNRSVMVRATTAQVRLGSYITASRCILDSSPTSLVLWFEDERPGETVNATEIRWLTFDPDAGAIDVHYIQFPDTWTAAMIDMENVELPVTSDWTTVLTKHASVGYVKTLRLIDSLAGARLRLDATPAINARRVVFTLDLATETGSRQMQAAATLRYHDAPIR